MPFLENAIELDTYLISDYPQIVELADHLFEEIKKLDNNRSRTKNEEYRSKETLKILLINLAVAYESGVAVQYSRRNIKYSRNKRYGKLFFRYDRVIPIIEILINLGFIDNWTGFFDRTKNFGRESRMAARNELIELFEKYSVSEIDLEGKSPPEIDDLVQIRDEEGNDIEFKEKKSKESMIEDLVRYNKFISQHNIEFNLGKDTLVNPYFLNVRLRRMINRGVAKLLHFKTDGFMEFRRGDEEIFGYQIGKMKYLISDGPGSDRAKKYLTLEHKVRISKYKQYYNTYIKTNTNYK